MPRDVFLIENGPGDRHIRDCLFSEQNTSIDNLLTNIPESEREIEIFKSLFINFFLICVQQNLVYITTI